MKVLLTLSCLLGLAAANSSVAADNSFYYEPALNYNLSKTYSTNIPSMYDDLYDPDGVKGSLPGWELDIRGGSDLTDMWFAGVDLDYSIASIRPKSGKVSAGASMMYGLNIGAKIPAIDGLKAWFSYFFNGSGKWKNGDNEETKVTKITGMKLGVGYVVHEYCTINLEYWSGVMRMDLKNLNYPDAQFSGFNVGLSVPIEF